MCFGVPPKPTLTGPKPSRKPSQTSTSTRIHCPFQTIYSQKYPNSPLPPHLISSKTKHTPSKYGSSQSQDTPFSIVPMYASQYQPDSWTQSNQTAGGFSSWSSTPIQAPVQQTNTSISQTQNQNSAFLDWEAAKDSALAAELASQKVSQKAAAEKQEAQEFWDKVDSKLVFGEKLRTRFNPPTSVARDTEAKEEEKERRMKRSEKTRQMEEELLRLRKDEDDRKITAKLQSMLDEMKDPMMGKVSDLDKLLRENDRKAEIADARSAAKLEGMREERSRNERAREGRSLHRSRSRNSSLDRSRSRSRHRSTKGRQHGASPGYGNGYSNQSGNGYGSSMINPANYHYQMVAPLARSNSPQLHGYANQPLIQPAPNSNTYRYNQAIPFTSSGNFHSQNLLSTSQFNSTARGISGKLDYLKQGQHKLCSVMGHLDMKLDSMEERSTRRFEYLSDTLRGLNFS